MPGWRADAGLSQVDSFARYRWAFVCNGRGGIIRTVWQDFDDLDTTAARSMRVASFSHGLTSRNLMSFAAVELRVRFDSA